MALLVRDDLGRHVADCKQIAGRTVRLQLNISDHQLAIYTVYVPSKPRGSGQQHTAVPRRHPRWPQCSFESRSFLSWQDKFARAE